MKSDSSTWLSHKRAIVWICMVIAVLIFAFAYYFGMTRSAVNTSKVEMDSALLEQAQLDIAADTTLIEQTSSRRSRSAKTVKLRPKKIYKNITVSRDFLGDTVSRHREPIESHRPQ